MTSLHPWAAIAIVVLSVIWLVILIRVLFSPKIGRTLTIAEQSLFTVTLLLAILWTAVIPPWQLGSPARASEAARRACRQVTEGMPSTKVRELIREQPRVVDESETRGLLAEAWVYDHAQCIVHLIGGKVAEVDTE